MLKLEKQKAGILLSKIRYVVRVNDRSLLQVVWLSLVVGLMLIQQSCIKDEFTRPVRISLNVGITEQFKTSDTLLFKSGEIFVKEIQFDGMREVGEGYSFNSESGKKFGPQNFYPPSVNPEAIALFDIPQGIYTMMRWKFELSDGLEMLEPDDDDTETPGLILNGSYINRFGETLQVRIEIDPYESFECQSVTKTGGGSINIISGNNYSAVLYFDPYFAFRAISEGSLDDADYSDEEMSPILLISSDSNEELYEIILFRLQQSVKIIVS
jgi:hypothetical protein